MFVSSQRCLTHVMNNHRVEWLSFHPTRFFSLTKNTALALTPNTERCLTIASFNANVVILVIYVFILFLESKSYVREYVEKRIDNVDARIDNAEARIDAKIDSRIGLKDWVEARIDTDADVKKKIRATNVDIEVMKREVKERIDVSNEDIEALRAEVKEIKERLDKLMA